MRTVTESTVARILGFFGHVGDADFDVGFNGFKKPRPMPAKRTLGSFIHANPFKALEDRDEPACRFSPLDWPHVKQNM